MEVSNIKFDGKSVQWEPRWYTRTYGRMDGHD